jgi:hypothetical protein
MSDATYDALIEHVQRMKQQGASKDDVEKKLIVAMQCSVIDEAEAHRISEKLFPSKAATPILGERRLPTLKERPEMSTLETITILMGIPGSGKDHYLDNLHNPNGPVRYDDTVSIVSSDDHHMVCRDCGMRKEDHHYTHPMATRFDPKAPCQVERNPRHHWEYKFDFDKLSAAHALCLTNFSYDIKGGGFTHVIVNNTNTGITEIAPYMALAQGVRFTSNFNPEIHVVHLDCSPEVAAKRNTHGVDLDKAKAFHAQLAKTLSKENWPRWWPTPHRLDTNG